MFTVYHVLNTFNDFFLGAKWSPCYVHSLFHLQMLLFSRCSQLFVHVFIQLKMMSTVHQTQPTIQLLLSTNEFVGALDLISTTQDVLSQELAGIHSFRYVVFNA